jgi:hypothetical protein
MLPLVLALLTALFGARPVPLGARVLAPSIAAAVDRDGAIPGLSREWTAAALVVTAWEEGGFCLACKRGDGGISVTTWQIQSRSPAHALQLESSPAYAARYALHIYRASAARCGSHPLAEYAGSCRSPASIAIATRRELAATALLASVTTSAP